jgi:hypothetical protein
MSTASGPRDIARFDELAEEFAERYRRGERPSLQEFVDRLPEMADEIREMFPAVIEVERAEESARWPHARVGGSRQLRQALGHGHTRRACGPQIRQVRVGPRPGVHSRR